MVPRVALVTVLVALVVVLGVLSMHAIDAHPPTGSHHGPASEAANPVHGHGDEAPGPAPAPAVAMSAAAGHLDHAHGPDAGPLLLVSEPPVATPSHPADTAPPPGHGAEGESAPLAQHLALCAAVILAAGSVLRTAPAARRVALFSVHRIVQAAFTPEPPVPRLALVAI